MSLLMEALRKAEQNKLQADKRLPPPSKPPIAPVQADEIVNSPGLDVPGEHEKDDDQPLGQPVAPAAEPAWVTAVDPVGPEASILTFEYQSDEELARDEPMAATSFAWTAADPLKLVEQTVAREPDPPVAPPLPEATPTRPSVPPEPQGKESAPPDTQPATSSPSSQVLRQQARAVFAAKSRQQRQSRRQRLLLIGAIIVGAAVAAGSFFLSFHKVLTLSSLPLVASMKGMPAPSPLPQPEPATATATQQPTAPPRVNTLPAPPAEPVQPLPMTAPLSPRQPMGPAAESSLVAAVSNQPTEPAATGPGEANDAPNHPLPSLPDPRLSPGEGERYQFQPQPRAEIRITRHSTWPQSEPLLLAAYTALQSGDLEHARKAYQTMLIAQPENRNAALGLATVAVRQNRKEQARDLYLHLLERDPSDPLARVGLMTVMPKDDPVTLESELKLLLDTHPDLAPLSFALGNLFAAGERWSEAQQAYFTALNMAQKSATAQGPVSPDYPFNLAVSLDHLDKPDLARRYYQEALQLATNQPAGFNREALRQRLAAPAQAGAP